MTDNNNQTAALIANTGALELPVESQKLLAQLEIQERMNAVLSTLAERMAKSPNVPAIFRGDTYACFALQQLALGWGVNPMLLAPMMYKAAQDAPLSMEGKGVRMVLDLCAPIKDHYIEDEFFGDWSKILGKFETRVSKTKVDKYGNPATYKVPAWKPEDEEGLGIVLRAVTLQGNHKLEYRLLLTQCQTRNSTLWAEDPQLQLFYRAVARFSRKYFPGVLGGIMVREEMADAEVIDAEVVTTPVSESTAGSSSERLAEKIGAKKTAEKSAETPRQDAKAEKTDTDKGKTDKPVSVIVCEELKKQGSDMDFPAFCAALSQGDVVYDPAEFDRNPPAWLLDDVPRWVKFAIGRGNK